VKNPFFDVMRQPMSSPQQLMKLLQDQQLDTVQTSVRALGCRDPMTLVSLQQEYVNRMLQRWTKIAAETTAEAETWHSPAADMPHPEPRPVEPTPSTKKKAESDIDAPPPATAAPAPANDPAKEPPHSAIHDAAEKATSEVHQPETAAATPAPETGDDDLTQIRGIGPKFAQTLKDHGITSYRKLAGLTAQEIEELEEKLGFSGRFERENWIEQARALLAH
jgi:predicted flap endonuclease-1-like 5' DNA nuclease